MTHKPGSGQYVLKFISGKYAGGEFALAQNQELIIGRSSDLEMVLIEDMVSRHHAKITTTDNDIYIEDLGSTNGTFVNGEKITSCKLKEGDRILIGTSIIKLVYEEFDGAVPPPAPMGLSSLGEAKLEDVRIPSNSLSSGRVASPSPSHTMHGGGTQSGVLSGLLDQLPLPDLLQLFGSSKKTGCLFITTPGGTEGRIYLREGRVYGAVINGNFSVPVDKSFYRMITWKSGTFLLDNMASYEFENPIDLTVESMLMEAMRIIDEMDAIGDDVPSYDAIFRIIIKEEPKLSDLTKEQLDIFQLALVEPSMEFILNKSQLSDDIETAKAVTHLVRNKYMEIA
jgi:hypothetical protein